MRNDEFDEWKMSWCLPPTFSPPPPVDPLTPLMKAQSVLDTPQESLYYLQASKLALKRSKVFSQYISFKGHFNES